MTQTAINYGKTLYALGIPKETVEEAEEILESTPELLRSLKSPVVFFSQKEKIIKRVFPEKVQGLFCVVCKYGHAELLPEIFKSYFQYYNEQHDIINASLSCVTAPDAGQLKAIKAFLCKRYKAVGAEVELKEDKSLIGGFLIRVGGEEFDYSLKGRIQALKEKLIWR